MIFTKEPIVLVDIETTGASSYFGRVIEVGAIRLEKGKVIDSYNQLVWPGVEIPPFISRMTGITESDIEDAPPFESISDRLEVLLEGATFVAHNVHFDYGFLKTEFRRVGTKLKMPLVCTVRLSRLLYPNERRHNLSALIDRFDFECENRHRALGDALVLQQFLEHVSKDFPRKELEQAWSRLRQIPS